MSVAQIQERLPTCIDDLLISKHVEQQSRDRGIDASILKEALENGDVIQDGDDEYRIEYDDRLTVDTYVFPIVLTDFGKWVLKTGYRRDA